MHRWPAHIGTARSGAVDAEGPMPARTRDLCKRAIRKLGNGTRVSSCQNDAVRLVSRRIGRSCRRPRVFQRISELHQSTLRVEPSFEDGVQRITRSAVRVYIEAATRAVLEDDCRHDGTFQPIRAFELAAIWVTTWVLARTG